MEPIVVLSAPLETDLSPLTRHLWALRIVHRVVEQNGEQILLLADPRDIPRVKDLYEQWQTGLLSEPVESAAPGPGMVQKLLAVPLTLTIVLLLIAVFGWQQVSNGWHSWLTVGQGLWPQERNLPGTYTDMGVWALWRQTLLHFSAFHLISNALWIWIFAGAMERIGERTAILALFLFCGLSGNVLQWWYAGPAFGGASGFVYGLAAWTVLRQTRFKVPYGVPPAVLGMMVIFMLITITSDSFVPGLSGVANGGHLGGLLCGFLLAFIWPVHAARTQ